MSSSTRTSFTATYATDPDLWDADPSFLAKLEHSNGSQRIIASGWHARQIAFEHPALDVTETPDGTLLKDVTSRPAPPDDLWADVSRFEIEISLDRRHVAQCIDVLVHLVPADAAEAMIRSTVNMRPRPSANRTHETVAAGELGALESVDLLSQNMPARAGKMDEPLRHLHRWCRIFALPNGTVSIYKQIDERFLHQLRWPHNGIWLNRGADYFLTGTDVGDPREALLIPVRYEEYNLENWRIEYEFWENRPFQIFAHASSKVAADRLAEAQSELSVLSEYLTTAFLAARNLEYRTRTSTLIGRDPELRGLLEDRAAALFERVEAYRELLVRGSGVLADAAQSVQAIAHQEDSAASRFMNAMLAYASAIFLLPTLIISFYSMSIIGQPDSDVSTTVAFVFILCLGSVALGLIFVTGVTAVLRRRARSRAGRPGSSNDHRSRRRGGER